MDTRFVPLDNTYGPGGYVFDRQDRTLVFWSRSMIYAVLASQALEHATDEEVAAVKADGRLRFEAYKAAGNTDRIIFDIREREGLLSDGEVRPTYGEPGDVGGPIHEAVEYDAAARKEEAC